MIKRFLDCYIDTETCNLRCPYCYITQERKFNNKLMHLARSPEEISSAFDPSRFGGYCLINLCAGGETLLADDVINLSLILLKLGHSVMIVTNGTISTRFVEISKFPLEFRHRLFIKFSFHYEQFKKNNLLDVFTRNVNLMKQSEVSYTIEITPYDELIPLIPEIREFSLQHFGALPHCTVARNNITLTDILSKYTKKQYKKIWSNAFSSNLFDFKMKIWGKKYHHFCYAGLYSLYIDISSGTYSQCLCGKMLGNIYDLSKNVIFEPIGYNCTLPHCYNGHVWFCLGDMPSLKTPTYYDLRNRICVDNSCWVTNEIAEIFKQRMFYYNPKYTVNKKIVLWLKHITPKKIRTLIKKLKH